MTSQTRPQSLINSHWMHVPSTLAGVLPVSPNETDFPYEAHSWLALELMAAPRAIVYDCGASYGILSTLLALAGAEVHAFEANPDVTAEARALWASNDVAVALTEACVGESSGADVEFYRAPGLSSVASSRHTAVKDAFAEAQVVSVPMVALDDYAERNNHTPACLKIDIEGSEFVAIEGARRLLESAQPAIVLETHPRQMIGGTLEELCARLVELRYTLFDLQGGCVVSPAGFAARYHTLAGYLMAVPGREQQLLPVLEERHAAMVAHWADRERHAEAVRQARKTMDTDPAQAVPALEQVVSQSATHAEAHYLLAWCLHTAHIDSTRALLHYSKALALGFDPFWVHYNWGALLFDLNRREEAAHHIQKARSINPTHDGVIFYSNALLIPWNPRGTHDQP